MPFVRRHTRVIDSNQQIQQSISLENAVKIGDVFVTSWGYDQTNYDFIVVEKISPSGKTAICRLARLESSVPYGQVNIQIPTAQGYGVEFRMRIERSKYDGRIWLRGSYPYIASNPTMEHTRLGTFSKVEPGDKFYETDAQFGH